MKVSADKLSKSMIKYLGLKYKTDNDIFLKLKTDLEQALKNADNLEMHWQKVGFSTTKVEMNPSTNVQVIVNKFNSLFKNTDNKDEPE